MLYTAYTWQQRLMTPGRAASAWAARAVESLPAPLAGLPGTRRFGAACQVVAAARPTHVRPEWGIDAVTVDGHVTGVEIRPTISTPFASVLHFAKRDVQGQPQVLVVGPISGHFATLLRPTVRTLLTDHDVHVIDWNNARDVPVDAGRFGLDEYIDHVLDAMRRLGPEIHVLAVCQPAPLVLAAVSLLAAAGDSAQPRSLTLVAGPIDTRVNPNQINSVASRPPLTMYERLLTTRVPAGYAGAGRRVYPGAAQLTAFMSMKVRRHLSAHVDLYRALASGDHATATRIRDFYDEYGAVMDVPAEFYLETLKRIFMDHDLPEGRFTWRGEQVRPSAIRKTALLTVEGAQDDLCSPGQTEAAHGLCTSIPTERKRHHLQQGVGHYGVFAGTTWQSEIYPVIREFIAQNETSRRRTPSAGRRSLTAVGS